jgi:hypothetical protein
MTQPNEQLIEIEIPKPDIVNAIKAFVRNNHEGTLTGEAFSDLFNVIQQTREELERSYNEQDRLMQSKNHYEQRAEAYWAKIGLLELELEQVKTEPNEPEIMKGS